MTVTNGRRLEVVVPAARDAPAFGDSHYAHIRLGFVPSASRLVILLVALARMHVETVTNCRCPSPERLLLVTVSALQGDLRRYDVARRPVDPLQQREM